MTTHILFADQIAAASEALLESKRHAEQKKELLKHAKLALKQAEKALKCAKKESRKAAKVEVKAQKLLDDLRREIKTSKKRPSAKPAKFRDAVVPEVLAAIAGEQAKAT